MLEFFRRLLGPSPVPAPEPEASGSPAPAPEGAVVLVVDDDAVVRSFCRAVLGSRSRVLSAEGGEQGLALAQAYGPDLVLLDAMMPGMDGFEVCRRLKADHRTRDIPVLFITSLQGQADEIRALEVGAIDFISKPLNPSVLAARVRNHLDLKRSKDRLMQMSVQDALTGIANRRHMDQVLETEWQRSRREATPISVLLGDIDCFKAYNDVCGHQEGDECLRHVARVFLKALRRPGDLAARYGGEEFVCILPDTDEAGAASVAEKVRQGLAALALPHPASQVSRYVTVSLGMATARPRAGDDPGGLLAEADRRMYAAKAQAKGAPGDRA